MPALTDPRWESACQERAAGGNVAASYAAAGFSPNPSAATQFFKRPTVITRVAEIIADKHANQRKATEIAVKKAGLEESWIIERLKYGIELAVRGEPILDDAGNPTGKFGRRNLRALAALLAQAIAIKGMAIQRHEIGGPGDFARLTDEELHAELVKTVEDLGMPVEAFAQLMIGKSDGSV
jgi:hypothetical protein